MLKIKRIIPYIAVVLLPFGCKDYLDEKPDKTLAVPSGLKDLQALIDNYAIINNRDPFSGEISATDYYLTDADWSALTTEGHKRMYLWLPDYLFDTTPNDWSQCYAVVYYANSVLTGLEDIEKTTANQTEWDDLKGQALFLRAKAFAQLAFIFCPAYNEATSETDQGLPLRLNINFNEVSERSSVKQTYARIINDLKTAALVLKDQPGHVMRASRAATYGMLSRVFLSMRVYTDAALYADSCLRIRNTLIDYATVPGSKTYPFTQFNNEVIFESMASPPRPLGNSRAKISADLYSMYADGDYRKSLFFKSNGNGTYGFRGSYEGSAALFSGLSADEMYLTRAECLVRTGNPQQALQDMDKLLKMRIKDYHLPVFANDKEILSFILNERRKELVMRGIRWMDIKRLNREEGRAIRMKRIINGVEHELKPDDLRFALPVPEDVILLSGMKQNPR
ncbi:SusD-like starch-binding protein associating with outer membrane [Arcticibacter tournemirensis]|uniref:RagB/SusD family nutrient uptake outer membrane protein n=1 Tax=Arcticibacter tournemirensis TaxID=699437 RepID=A0A5M9H1X8_9SPHI|nr:RagB/SusD family nutrient uptake outer membrane protein [Arcticibacter tournemirensis]KAA8480095.1 RagB/SusD family nutrient uptake outer membrane protein [Arcticibacter tournemirensis]TQM50699.1 SusD-like starch-binding protein associating with outer membrane [Arcticibacter tournemirensis]